MVSIMHFYRRLADYVTGLLLIFSMSVVSAANISVKTDRQPVVINESFQMIFEADGSVDAEPDFSPLNKDFQVLSTSVSSNMSIINGSISSTKQWQLTVLARTEGNLTIPSISFGKDRSQKHSIKVVRASTSSAGGQRSNTDIFLEVEANTTKPYVQAQVLYTVKLYRAVNTANASLSDPEISGGDAVVERLGEDQNYDTWVQGKRFVVVERDFAIYPQVSGRLTIAPIRFQGQIVQNRFSMFDPFGSQGKTIIRQSEPVELQVQTIPDTFAGGHWLPSKNVSLLEQWSEDPTELKLGEPLTRTLILSAEGQTSSQLPEMPLWSLPDFKQYPDQAVLSDVKNTDGITGTRQEKTAIIPNKAGVYTLPEVKLPWWNTQTQRMEYAQLPERQITILAALGSTADILDLAPAPLGIDESEVSAGTQDRQEFAQPEPKSQGSLLWQGISTLLAVLWLLTLFLWWQSRRSSGSRQDGESDLALKQILKGLKQACHNNDAAQAKVFLLQWAKARWPAQPPMSIGEIGQRSGQPLLDEISLLSGSLYSAKQQSWDGAKFWRLFEQESQALSENAQTDAGRLEPLYKL